MIINDPKTPWEDDDPSLDIEMTNEQDNADPEVESHLEEARINRERNCQLINDTLQSFEQKSAGQDKAINIGDLLGKLQSVKAEAEEVDAAAEKKAAFKAKMKAHYKNTFNAA